MDNQTIIQPFGEINSIGNSATYTATSGWPQISDLWKIKMYQTHPSDHKSIEMSSVTLLAEELWPPIENVFVEMEEWDALSDEALLDFEASLD
ncbi:MAG: hypothetical protein GY805_08850 [Chloroflexi bacterium]|nr:hypothetical protein [Chloroflexota bacterium]